MAADFAGDEPPFSKEAVTYNRQFIAGVKSRA